MNAAAPPVSADLAPPERLHPAILLTGLGRSLRGMAGGYAAIAYLAATGRLDTALIAGGALLVMLFVGILLYWRRFEYRVGAHEIRIDSGIFNRIHRSIPFDRVQDVDISQGPLARLLGLAEVKFETGGSAGAGADEGVLPGIALARAEALREHVRARRGGAPGAARTTDEPAPLFVMDLKRVLTAGVFNFSLALFAGLFGATQTMGDLVGFDPFERKFWNDLLAAGSPVAEYVTAHRVAAALGGVALLVLIGLLTGIVRTLAREYRFRLDRTGTGLRRRRGLFTVTDVTLPLRRVQAALVLTGPVRDAFHWRQLKLQSLARDEGGGGDHVIAPLATDEELARILGELGWAADLTAAPWEPLSRAYVTSLLVGLSPLLIVAAAQAVLFPVVGLATFLLLLAAAGSRWLAWRRSGFAMDGERLLIRGGWWRRRTVVLPVRNIQSLDLTENFIGRRFGIASLVFGVAGGSGYSGHQIPALPRERASELRKQLLSRFA